ncbi:hypothetical protein BX666DRAFT_1257630 [Dichotomocladium elegans]|nr:hypothetical protein BX666DRAFT_1257630 [Dichotomocladium elegans]
MNWPIFIFAHFRKRSLQAPDDEQKYARWCKHDGKDMFIIECIPKFTEVVLPRLFKHCKFASFVRQLNVSMLDVHLKKHTHTHTYIYIYIYTITYM